MSEDTKEEIIEMKAEDAPTSEGSIADPIQPKPQSPEEVWAKVMNEMYKTVSGVVYFLAGQPKYGWIKTPDDIIFVASEFKTEEMIKPEVVGVMVVMGQEMVDQVRALLDRKSGAFKSPIIQ